MEATSLVEKAIRVIVADDHELMRQTLSRLLAREDDLSVIAEAYDLPSLVHRLDEHRPQVLVLDFGMLGGSSSETIRQLRERAPDTQLVVVTMEENPVFAQRSLAAGALGFVLKELAAEELPTAIRRVVAGERYLSPRLAPSLDDLHDQEIKLTAREIEVLRLIALGHTSAEIARRLGLSPPHGRVPPGAASTESSASSLVPNWSPMR